MIRDKIRIFGDWYAPWLIPVDLEKVGKSFIPGDKPEGNSVRKSLAQNFPCKMS